MRGWQLVGLLILSATAGCLSDGGADDMEPDRFPVGERASTGDSQAATAPTSSDGSVERDYDRTDGPIETGFDPLQLGWSATQTITLANDFASAQRAAAAFGVPSGEIHVRGWSKDAYEVVIVLHARGMTEMGARGFLEHTTVEHSDVLSRDGRLQVATNVVFEDYDEDGIPFVQFGGGRWADLEVRIPSSPGLDLTVAAASADVTVSSLGAQSLALDTASGDITVDAAADSLVADAASGDISVSTNARQVRLDTASGDIAADLRPTGDARIVADAASGDISLRLPGDRRHGYDVIADTASGDITIDLPDAETVEADDDDFRHVRTVGYASRDVQVEIVTDTASGDITIVGR